MSHSTIMYSLTSAFTSKRNNVSELDSNNHIFCELLFTQHLIKLTLYNFLLKYNLQRRSHSSHRS